IRTLTVPSSAACAATSMQASGLDASTASQDTVPPSSLIACAVASRRFARRATSNTCAPIRDNNCALALPNPEEPPVTTATEPSGREGVKTSAVTDDLPSRTYYLGPSLTLTNNWLLWRVD